MKKRNKLLFTLLTLATLFTFFVPSASAYEIIPRARWNHIGDNLCQR